MSELFPYGVYDTKRCCLAYVGLHDNEASVWWTWLGWPDDEEIAEAKKNGLVVLPLTVSYKPPTT